MPVTALKLKEPNKQQRALIELLADPDDFRSIGDKAMSVGYDDEYGRQLARDPTFSEWVLVRTRQMVKASLPRVYRGFVRDATADGLDPIDRHRAGKIVLQAAGEIQANTVEVQTNVTLQLPERLSHHLEARRSVLKEIAVVEHKGNGKEGNGHSD